jgi:hypothetical protein
MAAGELATKEHAGASALMRGVVFVYHGVTDTAPAATREGKYWVRVEELRRQLAHLSVATSPIQLDRFWEGCAFHRPVVCTFDDGRSSDYEIAYPLLAEAGIRACFFLNTANVGASGYLTWPQIREMHAAGMMFQSHSHNHVYLTRLSRTRLDAELRRSKQILEDKLGNSVGFLAVPYGEVDSAVQHAAACAGYRAICTSFNWPATAGQSLVPRVCVSGATSLSTFKALADQKTLPYVRRGLRAAAIYVPKRVALGVFRFNQSPLEIAE